MLLGLEAGDVAEELVDAQEAHLEVEQREADRRVLVEGPYLAEARAGLALAVTQLFLDLLAAGDVDVDARKPGRPARPVGDALPADKDPAHAPVRQHDAELALIGSRRGKKPILILLDPLAVVRVHAREKAREAHRLVRGKPVERLEGGSRDDRVGARVPFEGERAAELLGAPEAILGCGQGRLGPHAFGDVDRDAGEAATGEFVRGLRAQPGPTDLAARPRHTEHEVDLILPVAGGPGGRAHALGVAGEHRIEDALGRHLAAPLQAPKAAGDLVGREAVAVQIPGPDPYTALGQRFAQLRIGPRTADQAVDVVQSGHGDLRSKTDIPTDSTSAEVIEDRWWNRKTGRGRDWRPPAPVRSSLVPDRGCQSVSRQPGGDPAA